MEGFRGAWAATDARHGARRQPVRVARIRAAYDGVVPPVRRDHRRNRRERREGALAPLASRKRCEDPAPSRARVPVWPATRRLAPERAEPPRIVVVVDDPRTLRFVRGTLSRAGYTQLFMSVPEDLPRIIRTERPGALLPTPRVDDPAPQSLTSWKASDYAEYRSRQMPGSARAAEPNSA